MLKDGETVRWSGGSNIAQIESQHLEKPILYPQQSRKNRVGKNGHLGTGMKQFVKLLLLYSFSTGKYPKEGGVESGLSAITNVGPVMVTGIVIEDAKEEKRKRGSAFPSQKPAFRRMTSGTKLRGGYQAELGESHTQIQNMTLSDILKKAGRSGIGAGVSGGVAGIVQVLTLMWLRTLMNYQCRYGTSFKQALTLLFQEGGIPRFYRGLSFALVQAPLARFVSTAANDGVETLLENLRLTKSWGPGLSTIVASVVVGFWRMVLMPIDTCKTVLQVDSVEGFRGLMRKVRAGKISVLYQGAGANALSAIAAHYPWFYTFRTLSKSSFLRTYVRSNHLRNAIAGFVSSVISDSFTNVIRVVKTTKQALASKHVVSYGEVIAMILAADGWKGLFGRGLRTRILGNAAQSVLFTVIWRGLADRNLGKDDGIKPDDADIYDDEDMPLHEEI